VISFGRKREVNIIKKAFRYIMHANVAAQFWLTSRGGGLFWLRKVELFK
jgi:hypothetical protein